MTVLTCENVGSTRSHVYQTPRGKKEKHVKMKWISSEKKEAVKERNPQ